ncbi:hypothetical protein C8J57DRAFT_1659522 [Mycena rebaudengoi]|nr:hypothetical protein C8J57DRAFT_1659522 [Mycena rebaudengoi]
MEEEAASLTESLDKKQIWRAEGDEVAGKRGQQDEFIDDHLVLVSPACKLPEDLVREIFVASLPMNANSVVDGNASPLLLSFYSMPMEHSTHCRPNRAGVNALVYQFASLPDPHRCQLTRIKDIPTNTTMDFARLPDLIDIVTAWLDRSGALPLSISVAGSPYSTDISPLLPTLLRYSRRWADIDFVFTSSNSVTPLTTLSSSDVPNLRTVRLGETNHLGSPSQETLLSFLETPSLRGFRGWSDRIAFSELPLAWEHLQHLNLIKSTCLSAQEALSLLTRCHSLVTGSVYSDVLPIIPLLPTTSCLKRISLDMRFFNITDLIEGLRLVPSLQELCIRDYSDGRRLLELLRDTSDLCPNLQRLRLLLMNDISDPLLLELLRSRGSTLASLDARFFRQMELDVGPLAPSGVELSLSYSPDLPPTAVFWPSKYCPSEGLEIQGTEWAPFSDMW